METINSLQLGCTLGAPGRSNLLAKGSGAAVSSDLGLMNYRVCITCCLEVLDVERIYQ